MRILPGDSVIVDSIGISGMEYCTMRKITYSRAMEIAKSVPDSVTGFVDLNNHAENVAEIKRSKHAGDTIRRLIESGIMRAFDISGIIGDDKGESDAVRTIKRISRDLIESDSEEFGGRHATIYYASHKLTA